VATLDQRRVDTELEQGLAGVASIGSRLGLDPGEQGGARLSNLLDAFNKLKVPAEDRIAILKELHRSGKLHARLILED
jgi:hypothetical protein